jgi:hypothetical protein
MTIPKLIGMTTKTTAQQHSINPQHHNLETLQNVATTLHARHCAR